MSTEVVQFVAAPRDAVYAALLDGAAVQRWMVPEGMTSEVHEFEARVGGRFHISLTYDDPTATGKTAGATDTFHGRFTDLVPGRRVVQVVEFETDDPDVSGEMTITYELADAGAGTRVVGRHEGLPAGVDPADNEAGWRDSLGKLARLAEEATGSA